MLATEAQDRSGCPCGSGAALGDCCGRYHAGAPAPSAEQLMRARYSAYALGRIEFLLSSTLPAQQAGLDVDAIKAWSLQSTWLGLQVEGTQPAPGDSRHAWVSFSAHWREGDHEHSHQERSAFVNAAGRWYFIDPGVALKAGRNDPCPCGSGRKFKKCCADFV